MSDVIIKAEQVGKSYLIGHQRQQKYISLRDVITQSVQSFGQNVRNALTGRQLMAGHNIEEFWALRDVSFEIKRGDVVGIVGNNGAGKSTLLKVLSRITEPTKGRIELKGRVASLLEVGTGFHPELSGRENIYLNGAILGMSRVEIKTKFDEIVDFSGVENFLDTPVKRYSSGMYVRLAFSVAAHMEPEILVVDEVLAVGDSEFQKKCMGKMNDVSRKEGRTILFVSHNMGAITQLCNKGILLHKGTVMFQGSVNDTIEEYQSSKLLNSTDGFVPNTSEVNYFEFIGMEGFDNTEKYEFGYDEDLVLIVSMKLNSWHPALELSTSVYNKTMNRVFTFDVALKDYYSSNGIINLKIKIPGEYLVPGIYSWLICINHNFVTNYDVHNDVCSFVILETGSIFSKYAGLDYGSVYPPKCLINSF
jgi:lipopolysaccharide transport system ATP-binding protein